MPSSGGEVPEFTESAISPGFLQAAPPKGSDGREYTICPECGGEGLELRGRNISEWGWQIVCPDCGWAHKLAEGLDIAQYCYLMDQATARIDAIHQLLISPGLASQARLESVCLQLRMLLELVVLSSLVSNKDVWGQSQKDLRNSRSIAKKVRELKRIHPAFYPQPMDAENRTDDGEPRARVDGFLTESDLIAVYGRLGNILHAENPMGKESDYGPLERDAARWVSEVVRLLECHKVRLYHRPDQFYLIKMFGDVGGDLLCIPVTTTPDGQTRCAWPGCVSLRERRYCEYLARPWVQCALLPMSPLSSMPRWQLSHSTVFPNDHNPLALPRTQSCRGDY